MLSWQAESIESLRASQKNDGGWSYFSAGDSAVEPTAMAVAALHVVDQHADARKRGLTFIQSLLKPDGSIAPQPSQTDGTTIAAIAGTVAAACGDDRKLADAVADRLLAYDPETHKKNDPRIADDSSLRGFSWLPKTYSWVEPTAYGMILLHHVGRDGLPRRLEAKRLLLDRAIKTGGWNYGNSAVNGSDLEPQPMASAVALLALWDEKVSPVVTAGIAYLKSVAADVPSVLSLGWVHMALRARGVDVVKLERFGALLASSERSGHSPWHRAVALLAAGPPERNPFVI